MIISLKSRTTCPILALRADHNATSSLTTPPGDPRAAGRFRTVNESGTLVRTASPASAPEAHRRRNRRRPGRARVPSSRTWRTGKCEANGDLPEAFTNTLRKIVVGSRSTRAQQMFVYFNSFIGERRNALNVLTCDEAHRLRETSVNRFTKADKRAMAPMERQAGEASPEYNGAAFLGQRHPRIRSSRLHLHRTRI